MVLENTLCLHLSQIKFLDSVQIIKKQLTIFETPASLKCLADESLIEYHLLKFIRLFDCTICLECMTM